MLQHLRKLWKSIHQHGLYKTIQKVCETGVIPRRIFYLGHIRILELVHFNEKAIARKTNDYQFRRADSSMLDAIASCNQEQDTMRLRKLFEAFFKAGHSCFIATHIRDGVVAYNWAFKEEYALTFDGYKNKIINIDMSDGCIFCGNGYVLDKHRMKGVFVHLAHYRMKCLPAASRFLISVSDTNINSLNSNRRLGYHDLCNVICLCLIGVNLYIRFSKHLPFWWSIGSSIPRMILR